MDKRDYTILIRRGIQTAPFETVAIEISETFTCEEDDHKTLRENYKELSKRVQSMIALESRNYVKEKK